MNDCQQQIMQLPGGIQPHYCRLCRNLIIIYQERDRKNEETGTNKHFWQKFTLEQVCEFANSGCVMFALQLRELCQDKKDNSFLINGHLREICEAAYNKRLQLFYPLDHSRVPKELEHWGLEITWSAKDAGCFDFEWRTRSGSLVLEQKPLTLFAHGGDSSYPLRSGTELLTFFR
jgi:hypothetical protein